MKKIKYFAAFLIITALTITGCTSQQTTKEQKPEQKTEQKTEQKAETNKPSGKKFKIGINNFGQANFVAVDGRKAMIAEVEKLGGEPISTVTANVPDRIAAIESFIAQGVDAIIIQEGDIKMAAPALEQAKKKGIVIGSMESGDAPFVDVVVQTNNPVAGAMAAQQLMSLTDGKGNIIEIYNDLGQMIRMRKAGLHAVLQEYPSVKIAAGLTYSWPDFFPDMKAKIEAVLQAHPKPGDIVGVFATFDGVGVAASQAIREAGLQNNIVVVGVDGDPEAYKEMRLPDSPFKATIAGDPTWKGKTVVDKVFDILNGKKLPAKDIYAPPILITKDNIPAGQ